MKTNCQHCNKEITKYISLDYKSGRTIDERFKGQIKLFCSPECVIEFIDGINDEPKGFIKDFKLLKDFEWKIPECICCKRRTEENVIINYEIHWGDDLMRVTHLRPSLCSINCLRNYLTPKVEILPEIKMDNESLKQSTIEKFKKMALYINHKEDKKFSVNKSVMEFDLGFNFVTGFDYCRKKYEEGFSCELCSLYELGKGCCNGLYKLMYHSQYWWELQNNMIEFIKYFKENA